VLFAKRVNQKMMDGMLGLTAGIMIAASFWSLLAPAIEMSGGDWKPATVGFLAGGSLPGVLACSPKVDPAVMRVHRPRDGAGRTLDEAEET